MIGMTRSRKKKGTITAILLGGIFAIAIILFLDSSDDIYNMITNEQVAIQIGFVIGTITFGTWVINHLRKKQILHNSERAFLTSMTGMYAITAYLTFPIV